MTKFLERAYSKEVVAISQIALACAVLGLAGATIVWQVSHHFASPIHDDVFDRLRFYRSQDTVWHFLSYLGAGHNEHRIFTTRIIEILDEYLFSGREYLQIILSNALQICCVLLCYKCISSNENKNIFDSFFLLSLLTLLFINPSFFYTLIVPFQVQHAIMTLLVIYSAMLGSRATEDQPEQGVQKGLILKLVLLAVLASFTLANASVILISAAAASIISRRPYTNSIILAVLAVAHTIIMLLTTDSTAVTTNNIWEIFKFGLFYWGSPFLRFEPWPASFATWPTSAFLAVLFGSIVFAAPVVFGLLRLARPGLGGKTAIFGFTILVAVIVTGLAAGHSRASSGLLEAANKKYASFAALGWVGVLAILIGILRQKSRTSLPLNFALAGVAAIVLPLSFSAYARETRIWQKLIDRNWEAVSAAAMGVNSKIWLSELYTDGSSLKEYLDYIEPKGRGLFSYFPFRWGDDLQVLLASRYEVRCRSQVETVNEINPVDLTDVFKNSGKPAKISGWTWMTDDHAVPLMVVAADAQNKIVGAAFVARRGQNSEEWLGQKFDENLEWWGFARLTEAPPFKFYALSRYRNSFCSLGGIMDAR